MRAVAALLAMLLVVPAAWAQRPDAAAPGESMVLAVRVEVPTPEGRATLPPIERATAAPPLPRADVLQAMDQVEMAPGEALPPLPPRADAPLRPSRIVADAVDCSVAAGSLSGIWDCLTEASRTQELRSSLSCVLRVDDLNSCFGLREAGLLVICMQAAGWSVEVATGCVVLRLSASEAAKCLDVGVGVPGGCFGPGNTLRRWTEACAAVWDGIPGPGEILARLLPAGLLEAPIWLASAAWQAVPSWLGGPAEAAVLPAAPVPVPLLPLIAEPEIAEAPPPPAARPVGALAWLRAGADRALASVGFY